MLLPARTKPLANVTLKVDPAGIATFNPVTSYESVVVATVIGGGTIEQANIVYILAKM